MLDFLNQSLERQVEHTKADNHADCNGPTLPSYTPFASLLVTWCKAGLGKWPSANHLRFASRWLDALQQFHRQMRACTRLQRRIDTYEVRHPKTCEIQPPELAHCVVRHWLVEQPATMYEPVFTYNGYAKLAGNCSDAAVDRSQPYTRQRNARV